MNFITRLPGPLLVFFGATSLSFGGMIVKSFEGAIMADTFLEISFFYCSCVNFFTQYL